MTEWKSDFSMFLLPILILYNLLYFIMKSGLYLDYIIWPNFSHLTLHLPFFFILSS